jgi:hypothetical protein
MALLCGCAARALLKQLLLADFRRAQECIEHCSDSIDYRNRRKPTELRWAKSEGSDGGAGPPAASRVLVRTVAAATMHPPGPHPLSFQGRARPTTVRALPGRLRGPSVFHRKIVFLCRLRMGAVAVPRPFSAVFGNLFGAGSGCGPRQVGLRLRRLLGRLQVRVMPTPLAPLLGVRVFCPLIGTVPCYWCSVTLPKSR